MLARETVPGRGNKVRNIRDYLWAPELDRVVELPKQRLCRHSECLTFSHKDCPGGGP